MSDAPPALELSDPSLVVLVGAAGCGELSMRAAGDRRADTVVKRERYRQHIAPRYDVRFVVDDRPAVVEMWREEGCYVLTAVDPRLDPLARVEPSGPSTPEAP